MQLPPYDYLSTWLPCLPLHWLRRLSDHCTIRLLFRLSFLAIRMLNRCTTWLLGYPTSRLNNNNNNNEVFIHECKQVMNSGDVEGKKSIIHKATNMQSVLDSVIKKLVRGPLKWLTIYPPGHNASWQIDTLTTWPPDSLTWLLDRYACTKRQPAINNLLKIYNKEQRIR